MRKIIELIFEEHNYTLEQLETYDLTGFFAENQDEKIKNFFLVVFIEQDVLNNEFMEETIPSYTSIVKRILNDRYDGTVLKNTSLLVCCRVENLESNDHNILFSIEEDPYDFKKYVLLYTDKQVKEFIEHWKKESEFIGNFLNREIQIEGNFEKFKSAPNEDTYYNLITRLFIKIPFLKLDVTPKEFEHLPNVINEDLEGISLKELRDKLNDINEFDEDELIKNLLLGEGTDE